MAAMADATISAFLLMATLFFPRAADASSLSLTALRVLPRGDLTTYSKNMKTALAKATMTAIATRSLTPLPSPTK